MLVPVQYTQWPESSLAARRQLSIEPNVFLATYKLERYEVDIPQCFVNPIVIELPKR